MEHAHTKRYQDCLGLFIKCGGRNLSRIEREMRGLGFADFNRRILYGRKENGIYKPGWIERYGWRNQLRNSDCGLRNEESGPRPQKSVPGALATGSAATTSTAAITDHNPAARNPHSAIRDPQSFQSWLKSVSPDMTWDWKHQQYIYKHLQRVTDGSCKRLMIFLPPRHGKSELVTVRYAGWRLRQDPKMKIIIGSYNQRLADKFSRSIRKILSEEEDRLSEPPAVAGGLTQPTVQPALSSCGFHGRAEPPASAGGAGHAGKSTLHEPHEAIDHPFPEDTTSSFNESRPPANAGGSASFGQPAGWPQCAATASDRIQRHGQSQIANPQSKIVRMFPKTRTINTVSEWETAVGGGVKAVGVGAGVTGFGAQLIVIDDPVKSRAEAESETFREKLWNWYNNDLYTRLEPNGSMILIQTRWHEDDLAGRLTREMKDGGDQWEVINLPALAEDPQMRSADCGLRNEEGESFRDISCDFVVSEEAATTNQHERTPNSPATRIPHSAFRNPHSTDPLGRLPGVALCPERYDETALDTIKRQLGSYSFSALYQQSPTPADGGIFKREWFKRFVAKAPDGLKWKRGYDLAVSTKTSACYTASFRIAYDDDGNMYIADGFRQRIEFPEQRRYIISRIKQEKDTEHGIEKALHGQALLQDLRREARMRGTQLRGVEATADKLTRALKWAPLAEEGKVILVRGAWNKDFLEEVCLFPTGQFDDQVDAISMAVAMYGERNRKAWGF